jgi:dinuclear metal center YbgI/SA1388 family protein
MLISDLDRYFRGFLQIAEFDRIDASLNGLQVGRKDKKVARIAFAVDACLESMKRAALEGADLLFVHHGIFWGKSVPVTGVQYGRISFLAQHDLPLYAVHLPLDVHSEVGNNAALARILSLEQIEAFGLYKGLKIGFKGIFPEPLGIDEILARLRLTRPEAKILPFGKEKMKSVGLIAGSAAHEVEQAIDEELDLYVTGESSHSIYHLCLEGKINLIAGGHYNTEVWGVKEVARRVEQELGLETFFVDVPSGL